MKLTIKAVTKVNLSPSESILLRCLNAISSVAYWCAALSGRVLFFTYFNLSSDATRDSSLLMFRDIHLLRLFVKGSSIPWLNDADLSEYGKIIQRELPALLVKMENIVIEKESSN